MAKVAPEQHTMTGSPLKPQPKNKGNGCCFHCCGKPTGPVDVRKILNDGGKFIQHEDGRIVEYFLYGSDAADVPVLLEINGSMGTGWLCANTPLVNQKLKELNIRGLSITIPGYGYTSIFAPGYKLGDWPKMDVEPVLKAEGLESRRLMVEGASYGAGLALAVAFYFGERVTHLHVHVPYVPYELRKELGMPDKIGDDAFFDKDTSWANSCSSCCTHCCCCCVFNCCPISMFHDEYTKKAEEAAPGSTTITDRDIGRASRGGSNTYGFVHNLVGGVISRNWGFDIRQIRSSKMRVMVSYNIGDAQVAPKETLPKNPHGEWLAEHFKKHAAKCEVNIGGEEGKGNQHGAQQHKNFNGEFVAQLAAL